MVGTRPEFLRGRVIFPVGKVGWIRDGIPYDDVLHTLLGKAPAQPRKLSTLAGSGVISDGRESDDDFFNRAKHRTNQRCATAPAPAPLIRNHNRRIFIENVREGIEAFYGTAFLRCVYLVSYSNFSTVIFSDGSVVFWRTPAARCVRYRRVCRCLVQLWPAAVQAPAQPSSFRL